MSKASTTADRDAQPLSFRRSVPDSRTEIEFYERDDGSWEASQTGNESELVGEGATRPKAALDYCSKVVEYVEQRERVNTDEDGDGDGE